MRRSTALARAVTSLFAGMLVFATVTVLASPASATADALPTASVAGAHAEVNPDTPLFNVEVVFTLAGAGIDCSNPVNHDAELRWKLVNMSPAGGTHLGVLKVCTADQNGVYDTGTHTEFRMLEPMWSPGVYYGPEQLVNVLAELEPAGVDDRPIEQQPSLTYPNEFVGEIQMPKQPVWIGVGDGYTSATYQEQDCAWGQTAADCAVASSGGGLDSLDQPVVSWIQQAIDKLTDDLGIPPEWAIQLIPLATISAEGADLQSSAAGTQVGRLVSELTALAPSGERPGSWNWVGVTAGLQDSGVMDALNAWYPTHQPDLGDPTVNNPWAVGGSCPDYSGVPGQVTGDAVKLPLQDGLLNVIDAATSVDPGVRVVHPLYPYFVDEQSDCRTAVVDAVTALNGAVDKTALQTRLDALHALGQRASLDADDMGRVFDLPLIDTFDALHPTGSPLGEASSIQLTKPFGYPHPTVDGSALIGAALVSLLHGQEAATPPVVKPRVQLIDPTDGTGGGFYRGPVRVYFDVTDPKDPTAVFNVPPQDVLADGLYSDLSSPSGICSAVSGLCADPVPVPEIHIDSRPPNVQAVDKATGDPITPGEWFNRDVTVQWSLVDDHEGSTNVVSGINPATGPAETTVTASGQAVPPAGKLCDLAGNCYTLPQQVNIEKIAPTIVPTVTPATGGTSTSVSGVVWYKATGVTVSWARPVDTGGSGLALAYDLKPADQTVTNEGLSTVTPFPSSPAGFCDNAGNCTIGAVSVRIDRTGPTISFGPNAPADGATGLTAMPALQCLLDDSGVGVASSTCTLPTVTPVVQPDGSLTYTYSVTAADRLGNPTTQSLTFSLSADATPQCSDGIDNDGDGRIDYRAKGKKGDPDCTGADDLTEAKVTQCSDGIDNDGDGRIDFTPPPGKQADAGCSSPEDDREKGEKNPCMSADGYKRDDHDGWVADDGGDDDPLGDGPWKKASLSAKDNGGDSRGGDSAGGCSADEQHHSNGGKSNGGTSSAGKDHGKGAKADRGKGRSGKDDGGSSGRH